MFKEVKKDKDDGEITFNEFEILMKKMFEM